MDIAIKPNSLYVSIFPPTYKGVLGYNGYVRSFSSANEVGPFDILPQHENLVTVAQGGIVLVDELGKRLEFKIEKAVVDVSGNLVKVYVEY